MERSLNLNDDLPEPGSGNPFENRRVLVSLADGVEGTRQTLAIMKRLVRESRSDEAIRRQAEAVISGIPGKKFYRQAEAIHDWIQHNIKYVLGADGLQRVNAPQYTLKTRSGACADMSVLEAALLVSIGHPVRFVAMAQEPDAFNHVYVRTLIGDKWIASDPTEPHPFGWEPPGAVSRMLKDV